MDKELSGKIQLWCLDCRHELGVADSLKRLEELNLLVRQDHVEHAVARIPLSRIQIEQGFVFRKVFPVVEEEMAAIEL